MCVFACGASFTPRAAQYAAISATLRSIADRRAISAGISRSSSAFHLSPASSPTRTGRGIALNSGPSSTSRSSITLAILTETRRAPVVPTALRPRSGTPFPSVTTFRRRRKVVERGANLAGLAPIPVMTIDAGRLFDELARRQHGVAAVWQLIRRRVPRAAIDKWVRKNREVRLHRGVYG